jgi:hypothetical protein
MILKNISRRKNGEKLAFLTQNKAQLCKNLAITLVFEKNAIFGRKSQKIVIIALTPDYWVVVFKLSEKRNQPQPGILKPDLHEGIDVAGVAEVDEASGDVERPLDRGHGQLHLLLLGSIL